MHAGHARRCRIAARRERELLDQVAHSSSGAPFARARSSGRGRHLGWPRPRRLGPPGPVGTGSRPRSRRTVGDGLRRPGRWRGRVSAGLTDRARSSGPSTGCQQANLWSHGSPRRAAAPRSGTCPVARLHRGREPAAGRRLRQVRRQARDGVQRACVLSWLELRDRGEQRLGVRVVHAVEQVAGLGGLDHPARVHHVDPVRVPGDHAHVVRDQQHRHAEAVLEVVQQGEDLRLDGDIQRGGRLVGDQQLGLAGQRHGDHHALAQPAGQLMRVVARAAPRAAAARPAPSTSTARSSASSFDSRPVQPDRLGDLVADRLGRVQRGRADPGRSSRSRCRGSGAAPRRSGRPAPGPSSLTEPPTMDPPGGSSPMIDSPVIDLPQPDSPTSPRVSPGSIVQVDVADRLHDGAGQLDVGRQVLDLQGLGPCGATSRDRWRGGSSGRRCSAVAQRRRSRTSNASRSASPMRLQAITVSDDAGPDRVDEPPVAVLQVGDAVGEHVAPVDVRELQAEAEEAEVGDGQDRVGDLNVTFTMTTPSAFGIRCLLISRQLPAPAVRGPPRRSRVPAA